MTKDYIRGEIILSQQEYAVWKALAISELYRREVQYIADRLARSTGGLVEVFGKVPGGFVGIGCGGWEYFKVKSPIY